MMNLIDQLKRHVAFTALVSMAIASGVTLIDCQVANAHLASLGAREIMRDQFEELLMQAAHANIIAVTGSAATAWQGALPPKTEALL